MTIDAKRLAEIRTRIEAYTPGTVGFEDRMDLLAALNDRS